MSKNSKSDAFLVQDVKTDIELIKKDHQNLSQRFTEMHAQMVSSFKEILNKLEMNYITKENSHASHEKTQTKVDNISVKLDTLQITLDAKLLAETNRLKEHTDSEVEKLQDQINSINKKIKEKEDRLFMFLNSNGLKILGAIITVSVIVFLYTKAYGL